MWDIRKCEYLGEFRTTNINKLTRDKSELEYVPSPVLGAGAIRYNKRYDCIWLISRYDSIYIVKVFTPTSNYRRHNQAYRHYRAIGNRFTPRPLKRA